MKANQGDLSRLLINNDGDTKSEYETKLALARSLVINTKENGTFESKKGESSQGQRCRIPLDDMNDFFSHCHAFQRDNLYSYASPGRVPRPPHCHKEGVTFPLDRWLKFESLLPDIQSYTDNTGQENEAHWHVGGGVFVSLSPNNPMVDFEQKP